MSTRPLNSFLASILGIALIMPSMVLFVPQKAHAQVPGVPTIGVGPVEIKTSVESTISAIKSSLSWALDVTNTAANYANMLNAYVLQPLAFVLSGNLMKQLTSSVIGFVIGKANGTGVPQFIVDLQKSMQTASDGRALAYLRQINQTNSPFASSIRSALSNNYLQKTSLKGFWEANLCSLSRASQNVPAYLGGNWSQGGIAAWFSLTTQTQNNPYTLYQNTQSHLVDVIGLGVGGITGARTQELAWGQGMMSWCKVDSVVTEAQTTARDAYQACMALGGNGESCQQAYEDAGGTQGLSATGINPGDSCENADGSMGTIQTPGSVIKSTLDKVLGGQQDQIVRMGNVGPQINQILGNIGTVLSTVQFASGILGGDSGGLLAVNSTSASNPTSRLALFAPTQDPSTKEFTTGYLNVTQAGINTEKTSLDAQRAANDAAGTSEAASASSAGDGDITSRIANYESAWNTIKASASVASTSLDSLAKFCTTAADNSARAIANATDEWGNWLMPHPVDLSKISTVFINAARAQATDARAMITSTVVPVFSQVATASTTVSSARVAVQKAQTASTTSATNTATYASSVLSLQSLAPTITDVMNAQQKSQSYGGAKAIPTGSLTVSGGSLVDQMSLINTNAQALKTTVCNPGSDLYVSPLDWGNGG